MNLASNKAYQLDFVKHFLKVIDDEEVVEVAMQHGLQRRTYQHSSMTDGVIGDEMDVDGEANELVMVDCCLL